MTPKFPQHVIDAIQKEQEMINNFEPIHLKYTHALANYTEDMQAEFAEIESEYMAYVELQTKQSREVVQMMMPYLSESESIVGEILLKNIEESSKKIEELHHAQ